MNITLRKPKAFNPRINSRFMVIVAGAGLAVAALVGYATVGSSGGRTIGQDQSAQAATGATMVAAMEASSREWARYLAEEEAFVSSPPVAVAPATLSSLEILAANTADPVVKASIYDWQRFLEREQGFVGSSLASASTTSLAALAASTADPQLRASIYDWQRFLAEEAGER